MIKWFLFISLFVFQGINNVQAKPNLGKPDDISKVIVPDKIGETLPGNSQDNNLPKFDNDGDGFCEADSCIGKNTQPGDCDDEDADVSPKALEECGDGVDNDCDGETDDFEIDDEGNTAYCKEQDCTDGKSDDVDDLVDCDDNDCSTHTSCLAPELSEGELFLLSSEFKGSGCSLMVR